MIGERQQAIPFHEPALVLNSTAPRERREGLQKACWRCLAALDRGPVSAVELLQIAGVRYGARLGELAAYLRHLCGYEPGDLSKKAILCVRADSSNPTYVLAVWAEPGNREGTR